ncbi:hypothetical protein GGQ87_002781 [Brevundimonas alba]|uniref:Uncharacterized protein n=1 Tax=Brevundimonas alba TaxID=74314 RepID=A0A7X6BQC3_9CAUL|nr:hypothetical protein [Brevundimonas alba]NJC42486.1 hypothetical protein [Brevundimonas alba]
MALTGVAVAAFGLLGLRAIDLPGPHPLTDGERLKIEVVHPVEPEIVPGSKLDVGELVTGFNGVPPSSPAMTDVAWRSGEYREEEVSYRAPPPEWSRPAPEVTTSRPPEPEPETRPRRDEGRWFGFDAPRRDYQAERAARRARLEAMDRQAWEEREARRREWEWRRDQDRERRRDDRRWRDAGPYDRPDDLDDRDRYADPR